MFAMNRFANIKLMYNTIRGRHWQLLDTLFGLTCPKRQLLDHAIKNCPMVVLLRVVHKIHHTEFKKSHTVVLLKIRHKNNNYARALPNF